MMFVLLDDPRLAQFFLTVKKHAYIYIYVVAMVVMHSLLWALAFL